MYTGAELFYADRQTDGQTDGERNRRTVDMTMLLPLFAILRKAP